MSKEKRANLEKLLNAAWRWQHRPIDPVPVNEIKKRARRPELLDYAVIRMGLPVALLVIGLGLMFSDYFWLGAILACIAIGIFVWDILYEQFFLSWPLPIRIASGLLFVLAIVFASEKWIFRDTTFDVRATSTVQSYGPGSKINSIPWQPQFSDLVLEIKNSTTFDYDNFDAEVSTDLAMADLRQVRGLSDCKIATEHEPIQVTSQHMVGGQPVGPADTNSDYSVIPLDRTGKPLLPISGADWSYRIRCEKIPANSQFDFFGALESVIVPTPQTPMGSSVFQPPRPAKWISVNAKFRAIGRSREESVSKCPISTDCEAVKNLHDGTTP